ncbi:lysozyme inhibitor LprI family protein [Tropicimonas sp. IMCC6043]|uniref:lysozyme inhibitor LprI family protein n=1 Tax=Tropicimonas sp. IMCC6043 TaxID=2510645 RepID=UPI00101C2396|nr:lysozyme inhibitor LprI family protein [Tropicimonas sp. IMCC6043]RYH12366.1 DUF1311 domain-containing protein [Tropicimonas sp. IMCC6043]
MTKLPSALCCKVLTLCVAAVLSGPAAAQEMPVFSAVPAETCLAGADDLPAMETCIGAASQACMESTKMGNTTVGMNTCLDAELVFWDARLNAAYGAVMAKDEAVDAELAKLGSAAPPLAPALRAMQRAWITFRDARCDYEGAQWGGGTGGGPATLGCLMDITARQALFLEQRLNDGSP